MKMYGLIHIADAFAVSVQSLIPPAELSFLCLTLFLFQPSTQAVTGGIVRGTGKQTVGAVCNLVGFYLIGLPVGASLMFPVKMGIVGEPHCSFSPTTHCRGVVTQSCRAFCPPGRHLLSPGIQPSFICENNCRSGWTENLAGPDRTGLMTFAVDLCYIRLLSDNKARKF